MISEWKGHLSSPVLLRITKIKYEPQCCDLWLDPLMRRLFTVHISFVETHPWKSLDEWTPADLWAETATSTQLFSLNQFNSRLRH